jgi:DNA-directed RNA polymerase subunit M/transcription elongation factor TFIIS
MATSDLKFCNNCSNILYYRETSTEDNLIKLIEFCKRCGYERDPAEGVTGDGSASSAAAAAAADDGSRSSSVRREIVVYEKSYEQGYIQPQVDEVAFGDPAVPTTKEIVCPNAECPSRRGEVEPSAKFIVLNPDTYSILYRCTHTSCGRVWRNKN